MMRNVFEENFKKAGTILFFFLLFAVFAAMAPNAEAQSSYYSPNCSSCHGATPTTCDGCHHHGPRNDAATTNKTSYAPGETVTVTFSGGSESGWIRAILYLNNVEVARSTGPSHVGGGAGFPITFTTTAPTTPGSYTYQAAWYGNKYDTSSLPATFTPDPGNPNHGEQRVSTNSFTVTAPPTAPAISTASPLPAGTVGTAYSQTLAATGGTTPYAWSVTSGTLPAGLSLSSGGVLGGTPTAAGASSFTVQVTGGGSATKSFSLTINPAPVTLSGIAISGPASVNENTTATYAATATWSNGTTTSVTPTWTTTLGTISSSGVLTAPTVTANQTATIGASYTSGTVTRTASASVTIVNVQATLSGIAISGPASVNSGATGSFSATATWSDGTTTSVTPTWTTTLGTISSSGVLTAPTVTANQTATIGASYTSGTVTRTASASVTIAYVQATLNGIAINGASSVNESATATYTATATWSDGTSTTVTPTWSVSPVTYANVSASGVLTTLAVTSNQSVTLTASYTSGTVTRTATKSVSILDVAGTLNSLAIHGPASVNEGSTATYTATAAWSDGTSTTVTPTWSVSPASYASIGSSGVLTANAVSSTVNVIVTANYSSGGVAKSATLTVSILDVPAQTGTLDVMPADNAVNVPVDTVISAKESGSTDISAIFNGGTFTLRPNVPATNPTMAPSWPYRSDVCSSEGVVQGTFTYNATHTEATFTPNCPLANGTTYLASIAVGPGSTLTAPYNWTFTTIAASPDSDADGSPDNEDDSPHDGRTASRWSSKGTGKVHVDSSRTAGTAIRGAVGIADTSSSLNPAGKPAGYEFQDGMIAFQEVGVAPGSTAQVTVTFPSPIPPGSKVYQAGANGFHEVPTAVIDGNMVILTVTGGSPSVNAAASPTDNVAPAGAVLVDPVGVAVPVSSGSGSIGLTNSSGGGCAIVGGTGSSGSNTDLFLILAGLGLAVLRGRTLRRRD